MIIRHGVADILGYGVYINHIPMEFDEVEIVNIASRFTQFISFRMNLDARLVNLSYLIRYIYHNLYICVNSLFNVDIHRRIHLNLHIKIHNSTLHISLHTF